MKGIVSGQEQSQNLLSEQSDTMYNVNSLIILFIIELPCKSNERYSQRSGTKAKFTDGINPLITELYALKGYMKRNKSVNNKILS